MFGEVGEKVAVLEQRLKDQHQPPNNHPAGAIDPMIIADIERKISEL